jgi:hypothetical protein
LILKKKKPYIPLKFGLAYQAILNFNNYDTLVVLYIIILFGLETDFKNIYKLLGYWIN